MSDPTIEEESLISQDDIDKLLDSSSIEKAEDKLSGDDNKAVDELGELSQDDIDQLMDSNVEIPEDSVDDDSDDDDMELISQNDIDQLMNSSVSSKEDSEEPLEDISDSPGEDFGEFSQDDIDQTIEPAAEDNGPEDKYVIDESEAMDVQDCLIAQDTIDDLVENFDNDAPSEAVILDEEPVLDIEEQAEPEPVVEPVTRSDEQNVQEDIDLEDTDDTEDFLKPDSDMTLPDFDNDNDNDKDEGEGEGEDISQDDIDELLLESDAEDEDDVLISQDDIDTLLMAADQEDEDVLGDFEDNESDSSVDDDIEDEGFEDEDIEDEDMLGNDDFESDEPAYGKDQVVLEGDDEEPVAKTKRKKTGGTSQWYKSKLVIACASALIVLGITVPVAYFIFFSSDPGGDIQNDPIAILPVEREIEIETVDVHVREPVKKPGNMVLKDFVILASDGSKDMAYIIADISIDYTDQRAYHEIQNNLSFYRDLIYDSINNSFASEKGNEITQADILWVVETTLKKVLPGHYIARVRFESFKAS